MFWQSVLLHFEKKSTQSEFLGVFYCGHVTYQIWAWFETFKRKRESNKHGKLWCPLDFRNQTKEVLHFLSNRLVVKFLPPLKQKKSQPWRRFGYLVLIRIDFDHFISLFTLSFCFDWKDISNTRDSVSSSIQTPRIFFKILCCMLYFQLSSRCLDILMKYCLSCLIYYMKHICDFNTLCKDRGISADKES